MIDSHDVFLMCCLFLPEQHIWQEKLKIRPILELRKLRLSAVAACWKELKHTKYRLFVLSLSLFLPISVSLFFSLSLSHTHSHTALLIDG